MRSIFRFCRQPWGRALVLGLAVFGVVATLAGMDLGRSLENAVLDLCYRLRPLDPPPREILLVGIDADSHRVLGHPWPWPRRHHARVIRRLTEAGAALIVFDVFFGEPCPGDDDRLLAAAVRESGKVVLARLVEVAKDPQFHRQIGLKPLKSLCEGACGLGVSLLTPDQDGVVRRFHLSPGGHETLPEVVVRHLKPDLKLPPGLSGFIRYAGPPQHLESLPYHQVWDDKEPLPRERLQGRVVLVGRVLDDQPFPQAQVDAFITPFRGVSGSHMSGVELQGHIIHTLLSGRWGRELSWGSRLFLFLVVFLGFSLLAVRLSAAAGLGLGACLCLGFLFFTLWLFCVHQVWLPPVFLGAGVVMVCVLHLLSQQMYGLQEKRWLRQAFSHYLAPEVVADLLAHPERLELGGQELVVTVMFADLAGFPEISQHMSPRDLIHLLNDYLTPLTDIILAHGGTLDKYMDSSLMAEWGAPLPQADHGRRACQAALAMQRHMEEVLRERQMRGQPFLGLHLGLHTGPVVAGNVGSGERFNYTILGDTVNLAARLQALNRMYGTRIILSEASRSLAGQAFLMRELDQVRVRGRVQTVTIFELAWLAPGEPTPLWHTTFQAGRAAYLARDWNRAAQFFEETIRLKPEDGPATLYLKRCQQYRQAPPPPDWEGVAEVEEK